MTTQFTPIDEESDDTFDTITFEFMDAWEADDISGVRPTLGDFVSRYPQYAARLTDFVLGYIRLQRTEATFDYAAPPSPQVIRAGERVREALGLPQYVTNEPETTAITFVELVHESGLRLGKLSKTLGVPVLFLDRIERGLLTTWTTGTVRKLAEALSRTTDEIVAALEASLNATTTQRLAGAHFSARGGTPDEQAVAGQPQSLDEMMSDLNFTPEQTREWLGE